MGFVRQSGLPVWYPQRLGPKPVVPTVGDGAHGLTQFQAGHGYFSSLSGGATANLNYTTDFMFGSQCVQVVTAGDGGNNFIKKNGIAPTVDLTGKALRLWVKLPTPADWVNVATISVYVSSDNVVANFGTADVGHYDASFPPWLTGESDWCCVTVTWGDLVITGAPTRNAINSIWFKLVDQNGAAVTALWGGIEAIPEPTAGTVSVTFDDGFQSQYLLALPKLDSYRYPATAYPIVDIVGLTVGTNAYMTLAQLQDLQNKRGWGIGCHAYNLTAHNLASGFNDLSSGAALAQMALSKDWLNSNGLSSGADHFAWPRGYHNAVTVPLAEQLFLTSRSTWSPSNNQDRESWPPGEPHKLRVLYMTNATTFAFVQTAIVRAAANKEWLILVFHSIVAAGGSGTDVTQTIFNQIIDQLNTSAIAVRTIDDVWRNGM